MYILFNTLDVRYLYKKDSRGLKSSDLGDQQYIQRIIVHQKCFLRLKIDDLYAHLLCSVETLLYLYL